MVLDMSALQHLEVFELGYGSQLSGKLFRHKTVFEYLDHTVTKFGGRMLKRWTACPLLHPDQLNDRLNAIEDLEKRPLVRERIRNALSQLPDLESAAHQLYRFTAKQNYSVSSFELINQNRLR